MVKPVGLELVLEGEDVKRLAVFHFRHVLVSSKTLKIKKCVCR
jgi:hypothetical protein